MQVVALSEERQAKGGGKAHALFVLLA
jgi:hypothetical protein